ncbi:MAG: zinc ribbon domain-containing protein [Acidimicrobiia bacterium]|nr:zinc ribbon domain-containing protein [Acidimicrobiia bacterium]
MAKDKDPFDDLFEPFELEDGPPPPGTEPPEPAEPAEEEAAPAAPVEQVPCPSCGAYNPAYNRHCEQCGARLTKEPLPVAPAPMVRATPGGRALSVLAAAVLIVALIALLVNVFRSGDDEAATTTTVETTTTTIADISEITPTQVDGPQLSEGFSTSNVIDGDLDTEWQVNQATSPLALEFRFAQPVSIRYIEIYNITDQDRFLRNYRIDGYKITVDDLPGVENRNTLKDLAGGPQRIDIASIDTETLTLEVLSSFPSQAIGDQPAFEELAVAEVKFWGTPNN